MSDIFPDSAQIIKYFLKILGYNIMGFCKEFNASTQSQGGDILPVVITVYHDKSFTFICKKPPVAEMLKKALGISKGSGVPNRDKVGVLTRAQAEKIADDKMQDMNARDRDAAINTIVGTARSMGIDFEKQAVTAEG